MKYYLFFISIVLTILINVFLLQKIDSFYFTKEIIYNNSLYECEITSEHLKKINSFCNSYDIDNFYEAFTLEMLLNNYESNKSTKLKSKNMYLSLRNSYISKSGYLFDELKSMYKAILTDFTCFPIPKINDSSMNTNIYYNDSFGSARTYVTDNSSSPRQHEGIDIMAENNVRGYFPVLSVSDGTVENMGWLELGGYRIGIRSDNGVYFYYAHLESYTNIQINDKVKAGDLIGYMGDTGYSKIEGTKGNFDVHLHFGMYYFFESLGEEIALNPYNLLILNEANIKEFVY